jgi:hypothetical protein
MQADVRDGARLARDAIDKHRATAVLTEAGVDAMRGAWPAYERGILRYFASALPEDEVATLNRLLSRIATDLATDLT